MRKKTIIYACPVITQECWIRVANEERQGCMLQNSGCKEWIFFIPDLTNRDPVRLKDSG